jgi:CRP/FNR family transcriptional regulator, nitrogen oxide reductase regulator
MWVETMQQVMARARIGTGSSPTGGLFRGLTEEQSRIVFAAARQHKYEAGEVIFRAEEPANHLYLLRNGNVHFCRIAEDGKQILLRRLTPEDVFGLGTLIGDHVSYIGTAEALNGCDVFAWDRASVRRFAASYPSLNENALRIVIHYIGLYAKRHMALVSDTAEKRLAYALTRLASRSGRARPGGLEIDVKNEDLASLADINFFTASRLLKNWERKGALEKHRGKVLLRCPEMLLAS